MDLLISEVQKRSVLWNKWDPKFKDRVVADRHWDSVSKELGMSKDDVKKKWRSLRDQFLKEFKKIPSSRSGSSQEYAALYQGRWSYFRAMLFLKDTVTPRISDGNISDVDVDEVEEDINEEQDELEDIDQSLEVNISTNDYNISSPPSASFTTTKKKNKRSKKQETGNTFEQQLIDLETRKLAALTESPAPDDEDMHFFKSILPYFKKMSPIQKLRVRNEIQNILIRESVPPQQYFGSTNSHNQNYIIPSASTVHPTYTERTSNVHPTYIERTSNVHPTSNIPPNFQYPDNTHSSIQN